MRIIGWTEIKRNGQKVIDAIERKKIDALSEGADHLRDTSIEFLKSQSKEYGKSIVGGSIVDTKNWYKEPIDNNSIKLNCISEHASIVEFGGLGKVIFARNYGLNSFPVGQQQGNEVVNVQAIKLQPGFHYLESTMNSPQVRYNMLRKVGKTIWTEVKVI